MKTTLEAAKGPKVSKTNQFLILFEGPSGEQVAPTRKQDGVEGANWDQNVTIYGSKRVPLDAQNLDKCKGGPTQIDKEGPSKTRRKENDTKRNPFG